MKISDLDYGNLSFHHDLSSGILFCTFANGNNVIYPFGFYLLGALDTIA